MQKSGRIGNTNVIGIIKEVVKQDDESVNKDEYGLRVFQSTYFNYPLYVDEGMIFYNAMGNRKLYGLFSWNPFTWWSSIKSMHDRAVNKGIEGIMPGEGIVLGGVLVVSKTKGLIYQYNEQTGMPIPADEIVEAIKDHQE